MRSPQFKRMIFTGLCSAIALSATAFRAQSSSLITTADERAECLRVGGAIFNDGSSSDATLFQWCLTEKEEMDAACNAEHATGTTEWYYNESTKECSREIKSEGCFFTTACCKQLGLRDDCWELQTLRRYRDIYLTSAAKGQEDIAAYYRIAPLVLARMSKATRREELLGLYAFTILPCALFAQIGAHRLARRIYSVTFRNLVERYGLDGTLAA